MENQEEINSCINKNSEYLKEFRTMMSMLKNDIALCCVVINEILHVHPIIVLDSSSKTIREIENVFLNESVIQLNVEEYEFPSQD